MFKFPKQKLGCAIKNSLSYFLCLEFWSFGIVLDFVVIPPGCFARISNLPCQMCGKAIVLNLVQRTRFYRIK